MEQWLAVLCLLLTAVVLAFVLIFPGNNWDAIGYVAVVKSIDIKDKQALHTAVFDELRRSVSADVYRSLTTNGFQETVSSDPESLRQVLPFYRVKPGYIASIYLLSKIGMNPFFAAHLVSTAAVAGGLWLFFLAVRRRVDPVLLIMLPIFVLALGALQVARIITPDGLAFLAVALVFYLLLQESRPVLLVLPLLLLIRYDLIIFVLLIILYIFVTHGRWRLWSVGSAFLALLLFTAVNQFSGSYGYATLLWVSFVESVSYPAHVQAQLSWSLYAPILLRGLSDLIHFYSSFLGYTALVVLSFLLFLRIRERDRAEARAQQNLLALSFLVFLSVVIHFLVFPAMWPRFFAGQYFLGAMIFLIVLSAALDFRSRALT